MTLEWGERTGLIIAKDTPQTHLQIQNGSTLYSQRNISKNYCRTHNKIDVKEGQTSDTRLNWSPNPFNIKGNVVSIPCRYHKQPWVPPWVIESQHLAMKWFTSVATTSASDINKDWLADTFCVNAQENHFSILRFFGFFSTEGKAMFPCTHHRKISLCSNESKEIRNVHDAFFFFIGIQMDLFMMDHALHVHGNIAWDEMSEKHARSNSLPLFLEGEFWILVARCGTQKFYNKTIYTKSTTLGCITNKEVCVREQGGGGCYGKTSFQYLQAFSITL